MPDCRLRRGMANEGLARLEGDPGACVRGGHLVGLDTLHPVWDL